MAIAVSTPSVDESAVGSPPGTDDGRPIEPADSDQHMQGGSINPKLVQCKPSVEVYRPEVVEAARMNFAKFKGILIGFA